MVRHLSRYCLFILLLQACNQVPRDLRKPSSKIMDQVYDYVLRSDTVCEGLSCNLQTRWVMGLRENGHEYHLIHITCCNRPRPLQTWRIEIKNDSLTAVDVQKGNRWEPVRQKWFGPEKYGVIQKLQADQKKMLNTGVKFYDRAEMFTGNVTLVSEKITVTCDTLYWRNADTSVEIPGKLVIHKKNPPVVKLTGHGFSMKTSANEWRMENIKGEIPVTAEPVKP